MDWVISNCVVNLVPDKEAAFREIYRVLRPGGRFSITDLVGENLPPSILTRGKMGFGAPLGAWFRSDLQGFVQERLLDARSPIYEYLQREAVEAVIARHGTARADLSAQIWALLTLESWLRQEKGWGAVSRTVRRERSGLADPAWPPRA